MAINDSSGTGTGEADTKQCKLLHLYLRDVSLEAPNVPGILFGHEQPVIEFDILTSYSMSAEASTGLGEVYAVTVLVTVKGTASDKTLFLIEVLQGGLFEVVGYAVEEVDFLLRTKAAEILFPFCRELITSLVTRVGFPSLQLRPIDFESRYAQALQEHRDALRKT